MGCCCRRKRFLTNMQKMISPCMLLALRENEAAMDVSFYFIRLREFLPPANEVWGKVIFSEACVKNSVHRGVVSQHALQVVSQHALQVSRPTPKGEVEGDLVQAHSQGGSWGGSGPGPHPRGKLRGNWPGPSPDGYCCGRYASYWNEFLFIWCVLYFTFVLKIKLSREIVHSLSWIHNSIT